MASGTISGYWLVALPQGSGVVKATGPRSGLPHAVWLGTGQQDIVNNLDGAAHRLGLTSWLDANPPDIASAATSKGSVWVKNGQPVPTTNAEWDLAPTIFAAGLGAVLGAAGLAAEAGAAAAAGGAGEAGAGAGAAEGAGAGAGAGGAASAAANAAKAAVGALTLTSLFGQPGLWAGIGMSILGAVLILFGIIKLSGRDPTTIAKRVV